MLLSVFSEISVMCLRGFFFFLRLSYLEFFEHLGYLYLCLSSKWEVFDQILSLPFSLSLSFWDSHNVYVGLLSDVPKGHLGSVTFLWFFSFPQTPEYPLSSSLLTLSFTSSNLHLHTCSEIFSCRICLWFLFRFSISVDIFIYFYFLTFSTSSFSSLSLCEPVFYESFSSIFAIRYFSGTVSFWLLFFPFIWPILFCLFALWFFF